MTHIDILRTYNDWRRDRTGNDGGYGSTGA